MTTARILSLALLAFLAGCGSASRTPDESSIERSFVVGSGATLEYLVLGDSTAAGVGASYEDGFVTGTARHLARGRAVHVRNLAVSGATVGDVLTQQLPRLESFEPDLVLIAAGANDVTHLTSRRSVRSDLDAIVEQLIAINCDVRIVVTGAPDMSTPPRIPLLLRGLAGLRSERLNEVFDQIVSRRSLTFARIADRTGPLFREEPERLFSSDSFHPSAAGYATWTAVLNEALDRAMSTQPSHCNGV